MQAMGEFFFHKTSKQILTKFEPLFLYFYRTENFATSKLTKLFALKMNYATFLKWYLV